MAPHDDERTLNAAALAVTAGGRELVDRVMGRPDPERRSAQILAAMMLPAFLVAGMALSVALKDVLVGFIPATSAAGGPVSFILGVAGVILLFVLAFAWVRTGGFGLFE